MAQNITTFMYLMPDIRDLVARAEAYAQEIQVVTVVDVAHYEWRADRAEGTKNV